MRDFYQRDFKSLFVTFFRDPMNGLMSLLQNPPAKAFTHAMILFGSVFVFYFAGSYLLVGDMRDYMNFSSFLSIGLMPVMVMLVISGLSFLIKLIAGGANFRSELLTGGLCGIALGLFVAVALVFKVFGQGVNLLNLLQGSFGNGGVQEVISLYLLLIMINVFQQSLKSAGIRDVYAWYLSPISVLLAIYTGVSVVRNLF